MLESIQERARGVEGQGPDEDAKGTKARNRRGSTDV